MNGTVTTGQKAARLLAEGRVEPLAPARIFRVQGDHDVYLVVISATVRLCNCDARVECSHIEAAVEWERAPADRGREYEDALAARKARDAEQAEEIFGRLG